jgi:hypothetical protein
MLGAAAAGLPCLTCLEGCPELVAPPRRCIAAVCLACPGVLAGVQVKDLNLHLFTCAAEQTSVWSACFLCRIQHAAQCPQETG